ncbi:MAG: hypothetical protein KC652_18425 [Cyanobacteria bacterium HKST-UBA01]|nr:hypothetical protein [Cyanobacteria bacterium HKST-UBA01]
MNEITDAEVYKALDPEKPDSPDWRPTPANINALPKLIRKYIHDLETLCDPAGIVRENVILREDLKALGVLYEERRVDAARFNKLNRVAESMGAFGVQDWRVQGIELYVNEQGRSYFGQTLGEAVDQINE